MASAERVSIGGEVAGSLAFSQAVRAGGFVFVSGQPGIDETGKVVDGIEAQVEQALRNVERVLEDAGSGLDRIVRTTTLLRDIADLPAVVAVRRRLLSEPYPADTAFQAVSLVRPDFLVEIEVQAIST